MPTSIVGEAYQDKSATVLARIEGQQGALITVGSIDTIIYRVYSVGTPPEPPFYDPRGPRDLIFTSADIQSGIDGDPIFDILQLDPSWTVDGIGYNFSHTLPSDTFPIAPDSVWDDDTIADRRPGLNYEVTYTMTPTALTDDEFIFVVGIRALVA